MKLHNLINPELELKVSNHTVSFQEAQIEKGALRSVFVQGLPDNVFVFSLDKPIAVSTDKWEKRRNHFLNEANDKINKSCDGIIIHYDEHYLDIIFCELKSTHPEAIQYETQLINTKLFFDYLVGLFNQFYKAEKSLEIRNIRYVLFYVSKQRPLKIEESLRNQVEMIRQPVPKIETMLHYPETIIKYPCFKPFYNYVEWKDLII